MEKTSIEMRNENIATELFYFTEEQKQEYLPQIAGGEAIFTFAITEESGGYDTDSIQTIARENGDSYTLSGIKMFVPDANVADYILCAARTGNNITVFIVDAKSDGITINPLKTMAGDKLNEVIFKNVNVPKENILGEAGKGYEIVRKTVEYAAAAKCCTIIGAMQQSLDLTVDYAKERVQYDRPIGSFQSIQHYCANMAIDVDGTRFSTYEAAWKLNDGLPATKEVAIAKAWASEAFERVSTLAHQLHHDLHYYTRTGKAAALSYGSSDYYREVVASEMGL